MFKNVIVFRIGADWKAPAISTLEDMLQKNRFMPCAATQTESFGWVSPRNEEHSPMLEAQSGHFILKLSGERKTVPASAVKHELEIRCKAIEAQRGKKPGRKEKKEMKEDIQHELLPRAFSKFSSNFVWIDTNAGYLVIGTGSMRAADAVVTHVVAAMAAASAVIELKPIHTELSPAKAMAHWLETRVAPSGFTLDQECELRQQDDSKAVVRYSRHTLDIEEIGQHIRGGKAPSKLAMTYDDKVSFVLGDDMGIRKIKFSDNIFKDAGDAKDFDANVAIATAELSPLFDDLINALGGEIELGAAQADA